MFLLEKFRMVLLTLAEIKASDRKWHKSAQQYVEVHMHFQCERTDFVQCKLPINLNLQTLFTEGTWRYSTEKFIQCGKMFCDDFTIQVLLFVVICFLKRA